MLRVKFAACIAIILIPSGLAVAADGDDASAALPCNSLCQRWMGLAAPKAPEEKPLGTIDLHPAPLAAAEAPPADAPKPLLPPRRRDAERTDGAKHHGPKVAVLAKAANQTPSRPAPAPAVPAAALSVLGRSMASATRPPRPVPADKTERGLAPQLSAVAIPNLPVAAWAPPVSRPPQPVTVAVEPVAPIPDLPLPPPPSHDDLVAMLPPPAAPIEPMAVAPAAAAAATPALVRPLAAAAEPAKAAHVAAAATAMPPAFDVIAALILDGPRPSSAR